MWVCSSPNWSIIERKGLKKSFVGGQDYRRRRAKLSPPESCDTLFISERRKPLSRITVWLMINQVARAAGLEHLDVHPHMLRHSCGYALINKGVDVRTIQGYLGHRSISSTVRYTKLDSKRFAKLF